MAVFDLLLAACSDYSTVAVFVCAYLWFRLVGLNEHAH